MNTKLISKYLQLLRKERSLTQEDLAGELHISRQAVSKWETGTTIPDIETLLKLSKLYQISINDILEPEIPTKVIKDFEQIMTIPKEVLKNILSDFDLKDIVKALMGASPRVNALIVDLFPDKDFEQIRNEIGRIRIAEVEDAQREIVGMINLQL